MTVGIMGGVAMAQETSDEDGDSERQSFAARVADILGLDETTVQQVAGRQVFDQATSTEMQRRGAAGQARSAC